MAAVSSRRSRSEMAQRRAVLPDAAQLTRIVGNLRTRKAYLTRLKVAIEDPIVAIKAEEALEEMKVEFSSLQKENISQARELRLLVKRVAEKRVQYELEHVSVQEIEDQEEETEAYIQRLKQLATANAERSEKCKETKRRCEEEWKRCFDTREPRKSLEPLKPPNFEVIVGSVSHSTVLFTCTYF